MKALRRTTRASEAWDAFANFFVRHEIDELAEARILAIGVSIFKLYPSLFIVTLEMAFYLIDILNCGMSIVSTVYEIVRLSASYLLEIRMGTDIVFASYFILRSDFTMSCP